MDSLRRVSVAKHISEYMHRISLPQQRASQTALLNELSSKVEIIVGEKDPIVTTISLIFLYISLLAQAIIRTLLM